MLSSSLVVGPMVTTLSKPFSAWSNGARAERGYPVDSRLMLVNLTRPTGVGNTSAGTATVAWDYFDPMAQKAPFLGGSRKLPNGNFLGCFGSGTSPPVNNGGQFDPAVCMHGPVVEMTADGEVVFSASVGGQFNGVCFGFNAYRAYRIEPLYAEHVEHA